MEAHKFVRSKLLFSFAILSIVTTLLAEDISAAEQVSKRSNLLFHASFDETLKAELALGQAQPCVVEGVGYAEGKAGKGVLVRHLILPGKMQNSFDALTTLFVEFGAHLPLSLMSQYWPVLPQKDEALNRPLKEDEFIAVYRYALDLGFEHLYVQFPEMNKPHISRQDFLPDFRRDQPFKGSPNLPSNR